MQPHLKNDLLYLLRILEAAEKIMLYAGPFLNAHDFFSAMTSSPSMRPATFCWPLGEECGK